MDQKHQAVLIQRFRQDFDTLVKLLSNVVLPSYLTNFEEFQKMEVNFVIEDFYQIALNPIKEEALRALYAKVMQFVLVKPMMITPQAYKRARFFTGAIRQLDEKIATPVDLFIDESTDFLFVFKRLTKNANSTDIMADVKKVFEIIQQTSDLYYKERDAGEKENLKKHSQYISPYVLQHIGRVLQIVIENPDSKDYLLCLYFILDSIGKMIIIKGTTMLFGEAFLPGLKKMQHLILYIKEVEQFLVYDFSKPVQKNQEKKILEWLRIFSEMDGGLLETRVTYAFQYYSQVHTILANKGNSESFKKIVTEYYKKFIQERLYYFQVFKFENKSQNCIALAAFGAMFLDMKTYYLCERNIKLQLEINVRKICEQSNSSLYQYFCFSIEVLNYIPFFQDKEFNVRTEEMKRLLEKLTDIKKTDDACVKHLIQGRAGKLLEYFAKNIIIPMPPSINENEQSIEQLSLLIKKTQDALLYLMKMKDFYDAFFMLIKHFSPGICQNTVLKNFVDGVENQKNSLEKQLYIIEKVLQEKKSNLLIAKTIQAIVSYFRLNSLGYFQIMAKDYERNYCYRTKLEALCKALAENFPGISLSDPKAWENLLQKVFTNEEMKCSHALVFIVGVYYEGKGEYQTALNFYSHCCENKIFEVSTEKNSGLYLITQQLIEQQVKTCEEEKSMPKKSDSSPVVVPSVFEEVHKVSSEPLPKTFGNVASYHSQ